MLLQCSCCKHTLDTSKFTEVPTFCPTCGAVLIENGAARSNYFCHSCGKSLPEGGAFCSYCGMPAPVTAPAKDKKEKTSGRESGGKKTSRAAMKLYEQWMAQGDLSAENVKELTGYEVGSYYEEELPPPPPPPVAAHQSSYTSNNWLSDTPGKIGSTISALLRNKPFLVSLAVNAFLLLVVILLIVL
ncbi:MAG: zinc ribbon domain-containing protein [Chloroflexi bacterium]|nr:zinc ribbon domain-containing protein [Chloroflexota bacterium]